MLKRFTTGDVIRSHLRKQNRQWSEFYEALTVVPENAGWSYPLYCGEPSPSKALPKSIASSLASFFDNDVSYWKDVHYMVYDRWAHDSHRTYDLIGYGRRVDLEQLEKAIEKKEWLSEEVEVVPDSDEPKDTVLGLTLAGCGLNTHGEYSSVYLKATPLVDSYLLGWGKQPMTVWYILSEYARTRNPIVTMTPIMLRTCNELPFSLLESHRLTVTTTDKVGLPYTVTTIPLVQRLYEDIEDCNGKAKTKEVRLELNNSLLEFLALEGQPIGNEWYTPNACLSSFL